MYSDTAVHVFRRYVKLIPAAREEMVEYLLGVDRLIDVISVYEEILEVKNVNFRSGVSRS